MTLTSENVRFGHTSEETALVVDDYPYGFRLRTQIRYWIETTKHGDRFVSQTLNPKTDRWNKPKKSTYSEVGVMFLNEEGHVKWTGLSMWSKPEFIEAFLAVTLDHLSDAQKRQVALIKGVQKAHEGVEYVIEVNPHRTPEEQAAHDKEQAQIQGVINGRVQRETMTAFEELQQ